jgi:hypothetical protein
LAYLRLERRAALQRRRSRDIIFQHAIWTEAG